MMKTRVMLAAMAAGVPTMACAQDFAGARIEARIGYETPTVSGDGDVYKIGSAVSYGGEIGYDAKLGNRVTFGPYATYEASSVKLCDAGDCLKVDSNLGAGGRLGYAASPKLRFYGKAGYARIKLSADFSGVQGSESKGGVQGALGMELGLGKKAYAAIEANYGDYGKLYGINLQRRQLAGGLGIRF